MDYFPEWNAVFFSNMDECLRAVSEGKADCFLISNYRYNNIISKCDKYNLTPRSTNVNIDYGFAVSSSNTELYSILSKVTGLVPSATVSASLSKYYADDAKVSLSDFIADNPLVVIALIVLVLSLIAIITAQSRIISAEKKVNESQHQVDDLNKRVYVDALTSVRNKGAFGDSVKELQTRLDANEQFEFAIAIFDCDNLKLINDKYGHDKGDEYIKEASKPICHIFQHSPVFRIGGDEFAAIIENDDYERCDALKEEFEQSTKESQKAHTNRWEQISVSIGLAKFDPKTDHFVESVIQRADRLMYENKRTHKEAPATG
jgi:diguanylate cyclase (GGDEF)-like protein